MRRGIKWSIIVASLSVALVGIGLLVYFTVFNKNGYHVAAVEHTEYTAADFQDSDLQLYDNGTFHIRIVHRDKGLFFLGLGTYTQKGNDYYLTFQQAIGRQQNVLSDQMAKFSDVMVYTKSGNRIKFIDNNQQIYYFG